MNTGVANSDSVQSINNNGFSNAGNEQIINSSKGARAMLIL